LVRAELVVHLLDALAVERACVLGHSMGGRVALEAAARWPDRVSALALISSVGGRLHRGLRRAPDLHRTVQALTLPLVGTPIRAIYRRLIARIGFRGPYTDVELVHLLRCADALDFGRAVRAIERVRSQQTPSAVFWCDDDPLVEPDISRELAEALPAGPRASWPTGGHNPQKTHAVEIADALLPWLRGLTSEGGAASAAGS
jgi:pimeloyl-ACP methyl ester carboxylesterase